MALMMPGPMAPTMAIARISPGMDRKMSVTRMIVSRSQPLLIPASMPSGTPISMATPVTISPICSDTRAPINTREKMSSPTSSVPNQCSALGGCSLLSRWIAPYASSG